VNQGQPRQTVFKTFNFKLTRVKWTEFKLKSHQKKKGEFFFYSSKDTDERIKNHLTDWQRIFVSPKSDKELVSRIYKGYSKLNNKKTNNNNK
jgi:hypothetical protein